MREADERKDEVQVRLYHFAPEHLLENIMKQGLTDGVLPNFLPSGQVIFHKPIQWLTSDPGFENQSWATKELIDYDRTAVRLTVKIPKSSRKQLWGAHEMLPSLPAGSRQLITDWPGSEDWYLFFGKIPRGWIREVVEKRKEMGN